MILQQKLLEIGGYFLTLFGKKSAGKNKKSFDFALF